MKKLTSLFSFICFFIFASFDGLAKVKNYYYTDISMRKIKTYKKLCDHNDGVGCFRLGFLERTCNNNFQLAKKYQKKS